MYKERIKSAILVLLVLNCLQLMGQIWFNNKKLWPSGYNFFNSIQNTKLTNALKSLFPLSDGKQIDKPYLSTVRPSKIVLSSGNARDVYHPGEEKYDSAYLQVDRIFESLTSSQSVRTSTMSVSDFNTLLQGKSVYLSFGFSLDPSSLSEAFKKNFTSVLPGSFNVSDIIITGDTLTKESIVCMLDSSANSAVKFFVDYRGDEIIKYIDSSTFGKSQDKVFAFELKLDRPLKDAKIVQRILLDSRVLLSIEDEEFETFEVLNPLESDTSSFDNIVSALGYTPSVLRKSVAQDGTASYVENSATIRISPAGVVEYSAVETEKGIPLQNGMYAPYLAVSQVTKIAEQIFSAAGVEHLTDLHLVSDLKASEDEYIIKMNYTYGGLPVISQLNAEGVKNALYAKVERGYITAFKLLIRTFGKPGENAVLGPCITGGTKIGALDMLVQQIGREETLEIQEVFKCYNSQTDISSPVWGFKIKGMEDIVLIKN
ncbi:MAG: hypothetical protein PHF89_01975 [Eubacteriales bacterium]|nr:hypothetical protein [Eubacteriales bacterium]